MISTFELEERGGLLLVRCRALSRLPGIVHAFSTARADGGDGFDLGTAESTESGVLFRRKRFLAAAGFLSATAAIVRQVHGARLVEAAATAPVPEADGVVWIQGDLSGRIPAVRTADCVPILLADRQGRAAAAVHAGWRGTAAGIAAAGVRALGDAGVAPGDLVAAMGPAILACCYQVGPEVVEALTAAVPGPVAAEAVRPEGPGRARADLHAANRAQLAAAGVPEGAIHAAPWCTRCREDLFHSYRRQGAAAGRMMSCVGPARGVGGEGDP